MQRVCAKRLGKRAWRRTREIGAKRQGFEPCGIIRAVRLPRGCRISEGREGSKSCRPYIVPCGLRRHQPIGNDDAADRITQGKVEWLAILARGERVRIGAGGKVDAPAKRQSDIGEECDEQGGDHARSGAVRPVVSIFAVGGAEFERVQRSKMPSFLCRSELQRFGHDNRTPGVFLVRPVMMQLHEPVNSPGSIS